jgi:hypothetical protein
MHEPGNELHIVPEVTVPGGSVDYFLVSARDEKIADFVGIELQTLDTTGTVWPTRQRALEEKGALEIGEGEIPYKSFGMNWKMTAKTILIQLHHKLKTFEHLNKHLCLVIQDHLLIYLRSNFTFEHLSEPSRLGDSMHLHSYTFSMRSPETPRLQLDSRLSTDSDGIAVCLGLQAEASVEMDEIISQLEGKMSDSTRLDLG